MIRGKARWKVGLKNEEKRREKKRAKKKGKNGRKTFPELKTNEEEIILNKKEKERERTRNDFLTS